jgi:hypothetical protein
MGFNPKDYDQVEVRLARFWEDHPNGRVDTNIVSATEQMFIIKAEIYLDVDDPNPKATGLAEEHFMSKGVNANHPVENCETSALGRALANYTYVSKGKKRPSAQEMDKVARYEAAKPEPLTAEQTKTLKGLMKTVADCGNLDQLRDLYFTHENEAYMNAPYEGTTLRDAVTARRNEMEKADA